MKFSIDRENLLPCLQQLNGVIEKKQILPILSNILIQASDNKVCLTSTDTEIQIITNVFVNVETAGEITVPAKKLLDICRLSNKGSLISCQQKESKFIISSGKSRFSLSTLPAEHYPRFDHQHYQPLLAINASDFKNVLEKTMFSMAIQDVRFFLNGLMLEVKETELQAIASDGHRLAVYKTPLPLGTTSEDNIKIIIPRKGVLELYRLLDTDEKHINFELSQNSIKITYSNFEFSAKLIEGRLPDYNKAIPTKFDHTLLIDKELFKNALNRIAVLTDDDYRGVNFDIETDCMTITLRNPEHEEGEEKIAINYEGEKQSLGFNVTYVQNAVAHIDSDQVKLSFTDDTQGCLFEDAKDSHSVFIIMPMQL